MLRLVPWFLVALVVAGCAGNLLQPDQKSYHAARTIRDHWHTQSTHPGTHKPWTEDDTLFLAQIVDRVNASYVHPMSQQTLAQYAIQASQEQENTHGYSPAQNIAQGLLKTLDAHSTYMNREDYRWFQEISRGRFVGIGVHIKSHEQGILIASVIEKSPAVLANLQPMDIITHIDSIPVDGSDVKGAVRKLRGKKGSEVILTLQRGEASLNATLKRDAVRIEPLSARVDDGILILAIRSFSFKLYRKVKQALNDAHEQGLRGIIVDLRNNSGGLLNQAVSVSDLFLRPNLTIVSVHERKSRFYHRSRRQDASRNLPLVVMINQRSASASEIMAAALNSLKRVPLVGEKSYGKTSVQSLFSLRNGGALKLTTAYYLVPHKLDISSGLDPDFPAHDDPETPDDEVLMEARRVLEDFL